MKQSILFSSFFCFPFPLFFGISFTHLGSPSFSRSYTRLSKEVLVKNDNGREEETSGIQLSGFSTNTTRSALVAGLQPESKPPSIPEWMGRIAIPK